MRVDYAYNVLKRSVLDGHVRAGERLDVNVLVRDLGMSRQPVVEALKRLAIEGFVTIVPQVGCWVATPDATEVGDLFRLLAVTEAVCAQLAAERATADGLRSLRAVDRKIAALIKGDTTGIGHRYRMLNRAFHAQVHAMARSQLLHAAASGMWDKCDFYLNTQGRNLLAERSRTSHEEHAVIIAALAARDPAAARAAMECHVLQFGTEATQVMADAAIDHSAARQGGLRGR